MVVILPDYGACYMSDVHSPSTMTNSTKATAIIRLTLGPIELPKTLKIVSSGEESYNHHTEAGTDSAPDHVTASNHCSSIIRTDSGGGTGC